MRLPVVNSQTDKLWLSYTSQFINPLAETGTAVVPTIVALATVAYKGTDGEEAVVCCTGYPTFVAVLYTDACGILLLTGDACLTVICAFFCTIGMPATPCVSNVGDGDSPLLMRLTGGPTD